MRLQSTLTETQLTAETHTRVLSMAGGGVKLSSGIEERVDMSVAGGNALPGSDGEHRLQEKYGTATRALAFYRHQVLDHLNAAMQAFLARQEMMFVGTADARGQADSAFRCGHPGF